MKNFLTGNYGRRDFLKAGALAGAALAGGTSFVDHFGNPLVTEARAATPKRGGMLIHGIQGGSAGDSLDPFKVLSAADYARFTALYETLWSASAAYTIDPWLIESGEPNATLDEWTIRLKKGIQFHHGKTLSADDVIYSAQRCLDPATGAIYGGLLATLDLKETKKLDERTVRFKLKSGMICFPEAASLALPIVPTDFDLAKPVGTGPFKLQSFVPGQQSVMVRNENYWRDGRPYVDGITHVNFNDETARINALQGGQINMADFVSFPLIRVLAADTSLQINRSETVSFIPLNVRVDQKPYDDVRVREALKLLVDRDAMVKGAYLGEGRIANDLYAPLDPLFNKDLPRRQHDPDKAKFLLKQAGFENLQVELTTSDLGSGVLTSTELYAAQARSAGVDVKLNKVDSAAFYGDQYGKWSFSPNLQPPYNYFVTLMQADGPTSSLNLSHFNDEEFSGLFYKALAEADDAKRTSMAHRMQEIQYQKGGTIIWGFQNSVDFTRGVAGIAPDVSGFSTYRSADLWIEEQ
ncbi:MULTISPECIES: ABC transporter substrate-binding protein [unclassified Rhizobium]|uniref:ABC transporter substrate-binding protein n=1 Tax=unclassified Rhizobium TaxID=2613769 RepID=UPI000CDF4141|nr:MULTISPECIES: ABC transporter substrate-binding protein [Rhizobium]AVA26608.1 dipeptide/oligopeptide ABC transporter substrate-binding protein [Rhizobium sp. NXC24]UWU24341.1 ABC transporter substrate-binding protein [Rhizobium tropici]